MSINPNPLVNSQELSALQAKGITVKADAQQKIGIIEVNGRAFSVKLTSMQSDHPLDETALVQLAGKVAYMLLVKDFFKDEFSGAHINREGIKNLQDRKIVPHQEEGKDTSGHYEAIQDFIGQKLLGKKVEEEKPPLPKELKPPPLPPRTESGASKKEVPLETPTEGGEKAVEEPIEENISSHAEDEPPPLPPRDLKPPQNELDSSKKDLPPETSIPSGEKAVEEPVEEHAPPNAENKIPPPPPFTGYSSYKKEVPSSKDAPPPEGKTPSEEESQKAKAPPQTGLSSTLAKIREGNFKLRNAKERELAPPQISPSSDPLTLGDILIKAMQHVPQEEEVNDSTEFDEFEDEPSPIVKKEDSGLASSRNIEENGHTGKKVDQIKEEQLEESREAQIDQEAEKKKEISGSERKQEEIKKDAKVQKTKEEEEDIQKAREQLQGHHTNIAAAMLERRKIFKPDPDEEFSDEEPDDFEF